ncbi:MAG: hypothetical protein A4E28_02652 [Methanocella sp. PtaU1.Bin125]|nr:MAG: hypothetical protein A4E28_02652 [Methanocella sp. PtaU1.Bin125]
MMRRDFFIRATMSSVIIVGFIVMVMAGSASADSNIMLTGHLNYEGPGGVFYSPEGANVTAKYMGQEYFTRADEHGDYSIGPIPLGSDYILAFRVNYTDPEGNYHVWPLSGWHETLLPANYHVVQDMILIKSTAPTPEPTATPTPTPAPEPTATPAPTPEPTATPAPTPAATPTPAPEPTATPAPTQAPSVLLSGIGALAVLALIGYLAARKQ